MADSKKYNGSTWEHSLRKLTTATEAVENPLYSDGTAITSYTIKGNTVQNGTPTPDNPIMPQGTGVRTENLFDKNRTTGITNDSYINQNGQITSSSNYCISYPIPVNVGETYTWSFGNIIGTTHTLPTVGFYDNNDNLISVATHSSKIYHFTFTVPSNTSYIKASVYKVTYATSMLLSGNSSIDDETPMPYIPYGYKIPISTNQQTTNIYLGSTQTVRQIKKVVFDGTENWSVNSGANQATISLPIPPLMRIVQSSHYIGAVLAQSGYTWINAALDRLIVKDDAHALNVTTWKNYLAAQYAAGTPVTVWYVLATPTTATVNEPLMKIGDYADTLSDATAIPTTDGANSITVDTTVQPSEFTATWTGWHDASVKEWDGTEWNE